MIDSETKSITSKSHTGFLGLILDNALTWKTHVDILMPRYSTACYTIRMLKHNMLLMIHYAYLHSLMNYGIIFWGNSRYSSKVFKLQKRVVRIITSSISSNSCCDLFKNLNCLTFPSQYIFFLFLFHYYNLWSICVLLRDAWMEY